MPMLKLYGADDAIEAHLLKHMLEQRRIPVFITGEYLSGAAGDVPVSGLIDVWVLDDLYEDALDVLDDFFESQDGPFEDDVDDVDEEVEEVEEVDEVDEDFEDEDDDDDLIGPDGYYYDDMEEVDDAAEENPDRKTTGKVRDGPDKSGITGNPWDRVYRKF